MKIYRLSLGDTACIDYTEEQFNETENILITIKIDETDSEIVQGKVCYICADNLKHVMMMYVPVENFEVLDESN